MWKYETRCKELQQAFHRAMIKEATKEIRRGRITIVEHMWIDGLFSLLSDMAGVQTVLGEQ